MVKRRRSKAKKQPPVWQRAYLAVRLKRLRLARGFETARAFAEAIDQTESAYRRYEAGEAEPDLRLYYTMIEVLGVTAVDLLGSYREVAPEATTVLPANRVAHTGFADAGEGLHGADLDLALASEAAIWTLAESFAALGGGHDPDIVDAKLDRFRKLSSLADAIRAAPHRAILDLGSDARVATASPERRDQFQAAANRVAEIDYRAT